MSRRSAREAALLETWMPRAGLLVVIAGYLTVLHVGMPLDDRGFLHPDDYATHFFAEQTAEHGTPTYEYDQFPLANLTPYKAWGPVQGVLNPRGELVDLRGPLYSTLLAPGASGSLATAFLVSEGIAVLTIIAVYALAERMAGGWPAVIGTCVFAFAAASMFWGAFLISNLAAVGSFALGLRMLLSRRVGVQAGGFVALFMAILGRYEYLIFVVPVVAGWAIGVPWNRADWHHQVGPAFGIAAGLLILLGVSGLLYSTPNFIAVTRGVEGASGAETASALVGNTFLEALERHVRTFLPLYLVPLLAFIAAVALRTRPAWFWASLAAATGVFTLFFLYTGFAQQNFLLANSVPRYLLPVTALGAVGAAVVLSKAQGRLVQAALVLGVALHAASGVALVVGPDGFESASERVAKHAAITRDVDALPEGSVVLGEFVYPHDPGRAFYGAGIPEDQRKAEVLRVIGFLIDDGRGVYLPKFYPRYYLGYLQESPDFDVRHDPEHAELWQVVRT